MKEVKLTLGYNDNTSRVYTIGNFADTDPNIDSDTLVEKILNTNDRWSSKSYDRLFVSDNHTGREGTETLSKGITALQITTTTEQSVTLTDYEYDEETVTAAKSTGVKVTFDGTKTQNKTYNYINPNATDNQLYILGQSIANLSNDNFGGTVRVDTTKLSEPIINISTLVFDETTGNSQDVVTNGIASDATVMATSANTSYFTVGTITYSTVTDGKKIATIPITAQGAVPETEITVTCSDGRTTKFMASVSND